MQPFYFYYMRSLCFPVALIVAVTAVYCNWRNKPWEYQYPLHMPVDLAANFGEVRMDHFHMGLDLRTLGRENVPVYAAGDGYVSRISVTEDGYGIALYIAHRDGTTTLYGHLNKLVPPLQQYLRSRQYADKSWQQDIKIPADKFRVRKDELVAYSGNTGHSEGPHLHFEIIDTKGGNRLNPLLNGVTVNDRLPPVIKSIYWYDRQFSVYNSNGLLLSNTPQGEDELYKISSSLVSLGIEATDKNAATKYTLGIYKAELYMDDVLKHIFSLDKLTEENTRYVNGCVDYARMVSTGERIQYLFTLPGNHLPAYQGSHVKGMLDISDGKTHRITIKVFDAAGNTSVTRFKLQLSPGHGAKGKIKGEDVPPNKTTVLRTAHAEIKFGKNTFYDTAPLLLSEEITANTKAASPLIKLSNKNIPVHEKYAVSIATTLSAGSPLRKHTVMLLTFAGGRQVVAGTWTKNLMSASFNQLGNIQLVIDTDPPVITLKTNKNTSQQASVLRIICNDNLGTIALFKGEIDGQWVPFAKKGNEFTYDLEGGNKSGRRRLKITVSDVAGNMASKVFDL